VVKIKFKRLPYEPIRITSRFGPRNTGIKGASTNHKGVDLGSDRSIYKGNTNGGPIRAVLPFTVKASYYNKYRGWVVLLDHGRIDGNRVHTLYQHLKEKGLPAGKKGNAGAIIGIMGNTGVGAQLHLHFEVRINGVPVDPEPYLKNIKKEVDDMTKEEVLKIIKESQTVYKKPADLPGWAKPSIDKMIKNKIIAPNPDGSINLTHEMTRLLVMIDRMVG
jgi:hypothetical protein